MISYSEQQILEKMVRNSRESLQEIHTLLGKIYDEELALDLNRQAASYSALHEKALDRLLNTGIIPQPAGVMERAKKWGNMQVRTALNISTSHVASMLADEFEKRHNEITQIIRENNVTGRYTCELADEFADFEEGAIRILKTYC